MNNKGMTLIELMLVVLIIAMLSAITAPFFYEIIRKQQVIGQANVLFTLVYQARSEAIKRNSVVTICKSSDTFQCGGTWSDGWILFQDDNTDGYRDLDEDVITNGKIESGYRLSWSAFGSNNYIRFTPQGLTLSQNGTFKLCPSDNNTRYARAVVISKTARVRIPKMSSSSESYVDANGKSLECSED